MAKQNATCARSAIQAINVTIYQKITKAPQSGLIIAIIRGL